MYCRSRNHGVKRTEACQRFRDTLFALGMLAFSGQVQAQLNTLSDSREPGARATAAEVAKPDAAGVPIPPSAPLPHTSGMPSGTAKREPGMVNTVDGRFSANQIRDDLERTKAEIATLKSGLNELGRTAHALQTQNTALDRVVDSLRGDLQIRDEHIGALTGQLEAQRAELSDSRAHNTRLQQQLDELKNVLTAKNDELIALRDGLSASDTALQAAAGEQSALQNRLAEAKAQMTTLQRGHDSLKGSIRALRTELEATASALAEAESSTKTTRKALAAAEASVTETRTQAEAARQRESALQTRLQEVERAMETTQGQFNGLQNQRTVLGILLALAIIGLVFNWRRGADSP